jgi:hypothetical protein
MVRSPRPFFHRCCGRIPAFTSRATANSCIA